MADVIGEFVGTLSNRGERIAVVGSAGQPILSFGYADSSPWPTRADGNGSTLELVDIYSDYGDGTSWRPSVQ